MTSTTIYTVLLSQLKSLGYSVYPRPYADSKSTDSTLGTTLHFYMDSVDSETEGENPKQRTETASFGCDIQSTDIDDDLTTVLAIVDAVALKVFSLNVSNAHVEQWQIVREQTDETILYKATFSYNYWTQYE